MENEKYFKAPTLHGILAPLKKMENKVAIKCFTPQSLRNVKDSCPRLKKGARRSVDFQPALSRACPIGDEGISPSSFQYKLQGWPFVFPVAALFILEDGRSDFFLHKVQPKNSSWQHLPNSF